MTPEEYRQEWLKELYHTDYNNCRFSDNKEQFARDWIKNKLPSVNIDNPQNIDDRVKPVALLSMGFFLTLFYKICTDC